MTKKTKLGFTHPCFQNEPAHAARMHLPVARFCNIKCSFCNPRQGDSCVHGCVPGLAREVLTPDQAIERLRDVRERQGVPIEIVGIAGPGEPLFNGETFETLERIRQIWPQIHLCLSTNGLLLPRFVDKIVNLGVETLTVTVNSLSVPVARKVYEHVSGQTDDAAFERLIQNQLEGIEAAAEAGMIVKVNSVLIPGENETELPQIARETARRGAMIQNVLPLIPRPDARARRAPDAQTVERLRTECGAYLCQFERCRHCRADAIIDANQKEIGENDLCKSCPEDDFFQPTTPQA